MFGPRWWALGLRKVRGRRLLVGFGARCGCADLDDVVVVRRRCCRRWLGGAPELLVDKDAEIWVRLTRWCWWSGEARV